MALMYCRECGRQVSSEAPICPHCGVPHPVLVAAAPGAPAVYAAAPLAQRKDPGVAALLSLFIPGAGQMYKGDVGAGVAWLCAVFIGYLAFILPGFILHIICVVNAAKSNT